MCNEWSDFKTLRSYGEFEHSRRFKCHHASSLVWSYAHDGRRRIGAAPLRDSINASFLPCTRGWRANQYAWGYSSSTHLGQCSISHTISKRRKGVILQSLLIVTRLHGGDVCNLHHHKWRKGNPLTSQSLHESRKERGMNTRRIRGRHHLHGAKAHTPRRHHPRMRIMTPLQSGRMEKEKEERHTMPKDVIASTRKEPRVSPSWLTTARLELWTKYLLSYNNLMRPSKMRNFMNL